MLHRDAALAILMCSTVGCASSYAPRPSPRLSLVMDGGSYGYVRDGRRYEGGLFGGDIDKAVEGNPRAEKYAQAYKTGMATGFTLSMVGLAGVVGGLSVLGADAARPGTNTVPSTGLIIAGTALFVELIGVILELNAIPHLFDAVNAYNDSLTATTAPR